MKNEMDRKCNNVDPVKVENRHVTLTWLCIFSYFLSMMTVYTQMASNKVMYLRLYVVLFYVSAVD